MAVCEASSRETGKSARKADCRFVPEIRHKANFARIDEEITGNPEKKDS
jgi:hypothetical protein